jgi:hypothetical protein
VSWSSGERRDSSICIMKDGILVDLLWFVALRLAIVRIIRIGEISPQVREAPRAQVVDRSPVVVETIAAAAVIVIRRVALAREGLAKILATHGDLPERSITFARAIARSARRLHRNCLTTLTLHRTQITTHAGNTSTRSNDPGMINDFLSITAIVNA